MHRYCYIRKRHADLAWFGRTVVVRHNRIGELKASSGHCSDEEWETILNQFLVDLDDEQVDIEFKIDLSSAEATLHIRKNIQGITVGGTRGKRQVASN